MNQKIPTTGARPGAGGGTPALDWPALERNLAEVLAVLDGAYLILSAKSSNLYVQFAVRQELGLEAESVSNHYLRGREALSAKQVEALAALGWAPPSSPDREGEPAAGSPNFSRSFAPPVPWEEVARLAVKTLRDVLRVPDPGGLRYEAFDTGKRALLLPTLGLSHGGAERVVVLRAERRGPDSFHLWAYLDQDGRLHVEGQDLGPVTASVSADGEHEYFRTFAAEVVPRLVALLDGEPGEPILDLLARRWTGERSWELEHRLRESGIPAQFHAC
jgi:hypothetical protein